jgi:hypothetical protein
MEHPSPRPGFTVDPTENDVSPASTEEFHAPRESIVACGIIVASSWSSGRT